MQKISEIIATKHNDNYTNNLGNSIAVNEDKNINNIDNYYTSKHKVILVNERIELEAKELIDKLSDDMKLLPFYCKCLWRLPRPIISRLVATAQECGRDPKRLFVHLAKKEMES